jgi:hypothetical protein
MRTRIRTLGVLASTALLLTALGCNTEPPLPSPSSSGGSSPSPVATSSTAAACNLPVTQDPYDGFQIGVPDGWDLFPHNGGVVVRRDPTGTERTDVYPVLITSGLTPASVFTTLLDALQKQLAPGTTMTYRVTGTGSQSPAATLSLQDGQVSMIGQASIRILPEATPYGSSQGAVIVSWAPSSQFAAERGTLAAIGACYGTLSAALYQVMQDQVFTYPIPPGWSITIESQDRIQISQGLDAGATYAAVRAPLNSGVNSAQSLRTLWFGAAGIQVGQVLVSEESPPTQVANGGTQGQEVIEFTGTLKDGRPVHGLARVISNTIGGDTSGVIRLALATPSLWNSLNGALTHIAFSIQHSLSQDLKQWERQNRQSQAFAQQVQGFDYALTGVDLVHDSTTGATFEAPYAAYSKTGPDGPGYYSKANNRLQVETP